MSHLQNNTANNTTETTPRDGDCLRHLSSSKEKLFSYFKDCTLLEASSSGSAGKTAGTSADSADQVLACNIPEPFVHPQHIAWLGEYLQRENILRVSVNPFNTTPKTARALQRLIAANLPFQSLRLVPDAPSSKVGDDLVMVSKIVKGLGPEGCEVVARGLHENTNLRRLDIRHNTVNSKGFLAIAHALRINNTVKHVHLDLNSNWDAKALRSLAPLFQWSHSLRSLTFDRNKPDKVGKKAAMRFVSLNHSLRAAQPTEHLFSSAYTMSEFIDSVRTLTHIFAPIKDLATKSIEKNKKFIELRDNIASRKGDSWNAIVSQFGKSLQKSPLIVSNAHTKRLHLSEFSLGNSLAFSSSMASALSKAHITELSLCHNNISQLSESIGDLSGLQILCLSHNKLTALPSVVLAKLGSTLQYLDCSHNMISEAVLTNTMSQLDTLLLHGNQLKTLGLDSARMDDASLSLDDDDSSTSSSPALHGFYEFLPALTFLDLSRNKLRKLSVDGVGLLKSLKELWVVNNVLTALPASLSVLPHLAVVDCSLNRLEYFPPELSVCKNLEIAWDRNPLTSIPQQILSGGWKELVPYLHSLKDGSKKFSTVKLMFFGDGSVGKTSLLRAFCVAESFGSKKVKNKIKKFSKNLSTGLKNVATDGIEIRSWGQDGITFKSWDFAGQEVYYNTHSFFLSEHSIFLVCFDLSSKSSDSLARVDYWLHSLEMFDCAIFVVGTHLDDKACTSEHVRNVFESLDQKYANFTNIVSYVAVSSKTGDGVVTLMEQLANEARKRRLVNQQIPLPYMLVMKQLGELRKHFLDIEVEDNSDLLQQANASPSSSSSSLPDSDALVASTSSASLDNSNVSSNSTHTYRPIMYWSDFAEMVETFGVEPESVVDIAKFLHKVGELAYFGDDYKLKNIVFLDPQFLAEIFCSIVSAKNQLHSGKLYHDQLVTHFWKGEKFPKELHPVMLKMLQKFGIIYPLMPEDDGREVSLVPSLIQEMEKPADIQKEWPTEDEAAYNWLKTKKRHQDGVVKKSSGSSSSSKSRIKHSEKFDAAERRYVFHFLPVGFFGRAIVRILHTPGVVVDRYWKNGVEVYAGRNTALLEFSTTSDSSFELAIRFSLHRESGRTNDFQVAIFHAIETLIRGWNYVEFLSEVLITCSHCLNSAKIEHKDASEVFSLRECMLCVAKSQPTILCMRERLNIPLHLLVPEGSLAFLDQLKVPFDAIQFDKQIAKNEAEGVVVYKGVLLSLPESASMTSDHKSDSTVSAINLAEKCSSTGQPIVAIKDFNMGERKGEEDILEQLDQFRREVMLTRSLNHPNLVGLIGFATHGNRFLMLSPFMSGGDLRRFVSTIKEQKSLSLSWLVRLKVASDITQGLAYLHSQRPPLAHRDMKSPNVLMSSEIHAFLKQKCEPSQLQKIIAARLIDFGLSEYGVLERRSEREVDCPLWLAPEAMSQENAENTTRSDIYSLGIVLWELISLQEPFSSVQYRWDFELEDMIKNGLRPAVSNALEKDTPSAYIKLMQKCWDPNPYSRPTASEVLQCLHELECTLYPKEKCRVTSPTPIQPVPAKLQPISDQQAGSSNDVSAQTSSSDDNKGKSSLPPANQTPSSSASFTTVKTVSHEIDANTRVTSVLVIDNYVWAGCSNGSLAIYNVASTLPVKVLNAAHSCRVVGLQYLAPNNGSKSVCSCSEDGVLHCWELAALSDEKKLDKLKPQKTIKLGKSIHCSDSNVVSAFVCSDQHRLWIATERAIYTCSHNVDSFKNRRLVAKPDSTHAITSLYNFAQDLPGFLWVVLNEVVWVYSTNQSLTSGGSGGGSGVSSSSSSSSSGSGIQDARTKGPVCRLGAKHTSTITGLELVVTHRDKSDAMMRLWSVSRDRMLVCWSVQKTPASQTKDVGIACKVTMTIPMAHQGPISGVRMLHNHLCTFAEDKCLRLWSYHNGQLVEQIPQDESICVISPEVGDPLDQKALVWVGTTKGTVHVVQIDQCEAKNNLNSPASGSVSEPAVWRSVKASSKARLSKSTPKSKKKKRPSRSSSGKIKKSPKTPKSSRSTSNLAKAVTTNKKKRRSNSKPRSDSTVTK